MSSFETFECRCHPSKHLNSECSHYNRLNSECHLSKHFTSECHLSKHLNSEFYHSKHLNAGCHHSKNLNLFPQSLLILLSYLLSQDLKGFVGSSLFNISLKCSTHLCSLSRVPVLSTPFLALAPTSRLCHSPVIDLVILNSSLNSSYLSHQPFPLLQPSSLTNFSNLPWHSFSLPCFSHYTSLFISVSVVPILRTPFSILPLSSP